MNRLRQFFSSLYGSLRVVWRRYGLVRWSTWFACLVLALLGVLHLAVRLVPFDDSALRNLDVSAVITDRNGNFLRGYLSRDERWRLPVDLDAVSPALIQATIATEDKRFYRHNGIDWVAVGRAAVSNMKAGKVVSGASTLTMQVAGFAVVSRERTLQRKLKQAFLALQIDHHWSKREVLECYLTHASYGGNICGIEAASRRYFNKTAEHLSLGESTLLAGLPQSPERLRPDRYKNRALERRRHVLARMVESGQLGKQDVDRVLRSELALNLKDIPVQAPHFCDHIKSLYPGEPLLRTTLDLKLQRQAEKQLAAAVLKHREAGVSNGAIVILENGSGDVLALVGSNDYWNRYNDGQVNGAFGFRSPGSVLKPLFFSRALDEGLVTPDETLYDVPINYAGYSPQNYDRHFRGPVPALKSLAWSLNIPAIDILQRVGVPSFKDALASMDVPLQISRYGDPGLSLAIGTCSVRLIDMVRAYASLATDGIIREAVWLADGAESKQTAWVGPEAARLVLDALADETIRAPEELDPSLAGITGIAWKTGTSNGFRDAWTIAVTEEHTVGVWIGNMDGRASRALVGSKAAAPVALELAAVLQKPNENDWPENANSMGYEPTCTVSGRPTGPDCPSSVNGRFLQNVEVSPCKVHQTVEIDADTLYCLCTRCSTDRTVDRVTRLQLSHPAATWLRSNGHPWAEDLMAPHLPECQVAMQGEPPAIVSPAPGAEVILLQELPANQQKVALTATTADPSTKLYWFINGSLVGVAKANDTVRVVPEPGHHKIVCMDEAGRSSESDFTIERSDRVVKAASWERTAGF